MEYAWNLGYEDLPQPFWGERTMYEQSDWREHDTEVLGVLGGVANGYGVEGIVPEARLGWSALRPPTASSSPRGSRATI